jgi:endonuclease/exonuclease/phosphatase family metal-dependent hydrolase
MSVRVMTWNLWWRFGPWEQRQAGIVATLRAERADVICLQEVWASDSGEDQVATLAEALGFHHARTPAPFWEGYSFGNAVLSRWPILDAQTFPLLDAHGRTTHRSVIIATIDAPFGPMQAVSTHIEFRFDRSSTRENQTRAIARLISTTRNDAEHSFPVVVGADFNALAHSNEMRHLLGTSQPEVEGLIFHDVWDLAGDGSRGDTWSASNPHLADSTWPNRRIDYLLISWPRPKGVGKPISCWTTGHVPINGITPSDHFAVVADLRTE